MNSTTSPNISVEDAVAQSITINYGSYAILTVLIYDSVILFGKEFAFFWCSPISMVSLLYFLSRYGAILNTSLQLLNDTFHANSNICQYEIGRLSFVTTLLNTMGDAIINYIILLRVRALYAEQKKLMTTLCTLSCVELLVGIALTVESQLIENREPFQLDSIIVVCKQRQFTTLTGVLSWALPVAYGALLMSLVLYKSAIIWMEAGGFRSSDLVGILTRNQVFYFLGLIVVGILHISAGILQSVTLSNFVSVAGNPSLLAVLNARILFDMKERGSRVSNVSSSLPTTSTISEIVFGDTGEADSPDTIEAITVNSFP